MSGTVAIPIKICDKGYEFLSAVEDPYEWSQTKDIMERFGVSGPVEIVKAIALKIKKEKLRRDYL